MVALCVREPKRNHHIVRNKLQQASSIFKQNNKYLLLKSTKHIRLYLSCSTRHDGTTRSTEKKPDTNPARPDETRARASPARCSGRAWADPQARGPARPGTRNGGRPDGGPRQPAHSAHGHSPRSAGRPRPLPSYIRDMGDGRPPHNPNPFDISTPLHQLTRRAAPTPLSSSPRLRRAAVSSASDLIDSGDLDLPSAAGQPFPSPP